MYKVTRFKTYHHPNVMLLFPDKEFDSLIQDNVHELIESSKHANYIPAGVQAYGEPLVHIQLQIGAIWFCHCAEERETTHARTKRTQTSIHKRSTNTWPVDKKTTSKNNSRARQKRTQAAEQKHRPGHQPTQAQAANRHPNEKKRKTERREKKAKEAAQRSSRFSSPSPPTHHHAARRSIEKPF